MTVSRTAKTYQTNRQNFTFSSSQREFNDGNRILEKEIIINDVFEFHKGKKCQCLSTLEMTTLK